MGENTEVEVPLLMDQGNDDNLNDSPDELYESQQQQEEFGVESLDYEPIHSVVYAKKKRRQQPRKIYGYTGVTLAKWTITILIGILVGVVAYIIESSQEVLITFKKDWTQKMIGNGLGLAFLGYATFGIMLVLVSSCLVIFWAPAAAGGGVTFVMAYLNGNDIPDFFRPSTLFTKIFGTICTVSSGLPIGQEGPLVHIGAAIASSLTWMYGRVPLRTKEGTSSRSPRDCWEWLSGILPQNWPFNFYNDRDRREFISAGAAAGLAAAFGAPIGGVLFSLEEASSFWSRKVMWRALLCTSCATMVLSWLHERQFSLSLPGNISFHGLQPEFDPQDIPLFVVTSLSAGVLGACLNNIHDWLSQYRPSSRHKSLRVVEACLATLVSVAVIFLLPHFFGQCLPMQDEQEGDEYWFQYTCPKVNTDTGVAYYNDLATLFFSVPHQTIQQLLALAGGENSPFTIPSLAIHSGSFLLLFILAYGVATPGGIFMPSIMVGASFGACLGRIYEIFFPLGTVQPGLHALVGATAMLGGVFRTSISLVVIMVEGTGGIDFILPVIVAIVLSNWAAYHIHSAGAYESDLEHLGGVCFLQSEAPHKLISVTAADIMAHNVICFNEIVSVREVVKVLRETSHNGFPVLRFTSSELTSHPDGQLVGLILRHQIMLLLEERALIEVDSIALTRPLSYRFANVRETRITREQSYLEHAMQVYHHNHHPHRRYLNSKPEAVDELGIDGLLQEDSSPDVNGDIASDGAPEGSAAVKKPNHPTVPDKDLALDLRPWMNRAPITVRAECSARRVYIIFRTLGLRHLCVTDYNNSVIGMITRKDIAEAENSLPVVESWTPRLAYMDSSRSFGRASYRERTPQDVFFSVP
ncbi:unnamed protein product [Sphagnum jensenii]|uniref:Chloride channel protein n=1 Tax=Sphagnum jensenii TaxID=128206 RepID=A0ABP1ASL9_9BRYO